MNKRVGLLVMAMALLLLGSVAYASIPDSQGVIHACRKLNAPDKGLLRVLDSEAGQTCPSGWAPLNWHEGLVPNTRLLSNNVLTDGQVHALQVSCAPNALLGLTALAFDGDTIDDLTKLRPHALPARLDTNGQDATVYVHATGPESAVQTVVSLVCAQGPG